MKHIFLLFFFVGYSGNDFLCPVLVSNQHNMVKVSLVLIFQCFIEVFILCAYTEDADLKTIYILTIMFILVGFVWNIPLKNDNLINLSSFFMGDTASVFSSAVQHDRHSDLIESLHISVICHALRQEPHEIIFKSGMIMLQIMA